MKILPIFIIFSLLLSAKVKLTKEEQEFIKTHPQIILGTGDTWQPYSITNKDGSVVGFDIDILNLVNRATGANFIEKTGNFSEITKSVKSKKIEGLSAIVKTKDREAYLNFAIPYTSSDVIIFVPEGNPLKIDSFQTLSNKTVALQSENHLHSRLLKKLPPSTKILWCDSTLDTVKAVHYKKAHATLGVESVFHTLFQNGLPMLESAFVLPEKVDLYFAVRKEYPEAIDILNKGLLTISEEEIIRLKRRWLLALPESKINWKLILGVVVISLSILLIIIFINRQLKQLVAKRTHELSELNKNLEKIVKERTQKLEKANQEIHKSLNHASLIQQTILPDRVILSEFSKESFIFWRPKDVVGGDIYFIDKLSDDELLIMVIDGAGHGVSGAFVTFLVKAIQTQIISDIKIGILKPNPAKILEYFNKNIKNILKQSRDSKSNVGFDGAILYLNKKSNRVIFSGANIPLLVVERDELRVIKTNRQNVGYIRTKVDQKYEEYTLPIHPDMRLYLSTDGYYDQKREDGKRVGKSRFYERIRTLSHKPMPQQERELVEEFHTLTSHYVQIDDVTVMGLLF